MKFPKIHLLILLVTMLLVCGCASTAEETEPAATQPQETATEPVKQEPTPLPVIPVTEATEETLPPLPDLAWIDIGGFRYPDVFGQPKLGQETVSGLARAGNTDYAAASITNVGDALYYIMELPEFNQPPQACEIFVKLLEEDYPTVTTGYYYWDDNAFCMVFIEHEGAYYAFDPFRPGNHWLSEAENEIARDLDLSTLGQKVLEAMPWQGTNLLALKIDIPFDQQMLTSYPEFGPPVLGQEQAAKLYITGTEEAAAEKITHFIDAYYYMQQYGTWSSTRDCAMLFVKLLDGDYDAIGTIQLRFDDNHYYLPYIQHEGMYYVFDPHTPLSRDIFQPHAYWIYQPENDCLKNTDLNALGQKLSEAYPYFGTNLLYIDITMDMQTLLKYHAPELGEAVLGKEAAAQLYHSNDFDTAAQRITHADDAALYMAEARKSEKLSNSRVVCERFARLLDGDYEAVGSIEVRYAYSSLYLAYVQQGGKYYIFDLLQEAQWVYSPQYGCDSGNDLEQLVEKLVSVNPRASGEHIITQVFGDLSKPHGTEVFDYAGFTFPVGLGKPQLTSQEIAALAAETDYETVARTITTLADAVAYYNAVPITHDTSRNPKLRDTFPYFASAWQVMSQKTAFSHTACSLLHYLLKDDYEDVGYVYVATGGQSHYLMYIYQDGLYYLINPEEYSNPVQEELWLLGWPGLIGCAPDFQTIADSIVVDMKFDGHNYITPDSVYTIRSPGDLVVKTGVAPVFPEGTEVTRYHGADFSYAKSSHDWQSQTRMN